ncbi:MAG: type II toxin-antitoxin system RelE/ParE family toxin [Oscillospiraceae bacterium]|nr:type II toxin-antitoxin system RelE/ParE family toxin [Oscillospiraceae bacterium]
MDRYNVSLTNPAGDDLDEIIRYISEQLSAPIAALRLADAFDETFVDLEEMPEKYPLVPDDRLAALGYRKRRVKNYNVFFKIIEETHEVDVDRILYARRDWHNIL